MEQPEVVTSSPPSSREEELWESDEEWQPDDQWQPKKEEEQEGLTPLAQLKWNRHSLGGFTSVRRVDRSLFRGGKGPYTDVVVKCQDQQWNAHSNILKAGCPFFRACLESDCKEAHEGIITLHDDNLEACVIFLDFLYTWNADLCHINSRGGTGDSISAQLLLDLCQIADKYDVPELTVQVIDFLECKHRMALSRDRNVELCSKCFQDADTGPNWWSDQQDQGILTFLVASKTLAPSAPNLLLREVLVKDIACRYLRTMSFSIHLERILLDHPDIMLEMFPAVARIRNMNAKRNNHGEGELDLLPITISLSQI